MIIHFSEVSIAPSVRSSIHPFLQIFFKQQRQPLPSFPSVSYYMATRILVPIVLVHLATCMLVSIVMINLVTCILVSIVLIHLATCILVPIVLVHLATCILVSMVMIILVTCIPGVYTSSHLYLNIHSVDLPSPCILVFIVLINLVT